MWSSSRMSCNIRERGTSYCLIRSPYNHFKLFVTGIGLRVACEKIENKQKKYICHEVFFFPI